MQEQCRNRSRGFLRGPSSDPYLQSWFVAFTHCMMSIVGLRRPASQRPRISIRTWDVTRRHPCRSLLWACDLLLIGKGGGEPGRDSLSSKISSSECSATSGNRCHFDCKNMLHFRTDENRNSVCWARRETAHDAEDSGEIEMTPQRTQPCTNITRSPQSPDATRKKDLRGP